MEQPSRNELAGYETFHDLGYDMRAERKHVDPPYRHPSPGRSPSWLVIATEAVQRHQAVQDARELAVALAVAEMIHPQVYLEIGCFAAGTAWAFGQLPTIETIVTVDVDPQPGAEAVLENLTAKTHLVRQDSTLNEAVYAVTEILDDWRVDVLLIDGAHDYVTAASDWECYRHLVRAGGLVMLHDITPHAGHPEVEVHRLWDLISEHHQSTEVISSPGDWAGIGIVWA